MNGFMTAKQIKIAEHEYECLMVYKERVETLLSFLKDAINQEKYNNKVEMWGLERLQRHLTNGLVEVNLYLDTMTDLELWDEIHGKSNR